MTSNTADPRPSWLTPEAYPFESRFLDVDGHRIHYIDEGSGPPLLFVHAGPAWSFVYGEVIERLRGDFRCIALDFPGAGLSRAADGYRPGLEPASWVLERFVLALGLRDLTLVLHDLGGPVSFGFAARHPERVRAMAVTESFGWAVADENPKVARMLRLVGGRAFGAVNEWTDLLARGTASANIRDPARRACFRGPFRDRRVRRNAVAMLGDVPKASPYLREIDRALRTTLNDRPLLLIFGGKSPVRREFLPQWQERFPDARLVLVEGGHHFPPLDDPDLVAATIRAWWNETVQAV